MIRAKDLRCEYLKDPIGIGERNPRLTWKDEGLVSQSAFDILFDINGEEREVHRDSDSMHFDMDIPIKSRDRVVWKVRLYDENGTRGEYSEPAYFEAGLFEPSCFKGKWISSGLKSSWKKRLPVDCFKKEFALSDKPVRARLYASALGLHEIRINGKRAGSFVFAPGFTDYRKRIQYQTYDVTGLLKEGGNVIEAELADGWYRGSIGAKGRTNTYGSRTKLFIQLETETEDGRTETVISDGSFSWSNDGPVKFADLKDGERVDGRMIPSYSGKSAVFETDPRLFSASDSFDVREMETFIPVKKTVSASGKQIFHLAENIAGYICLDIVAREGQKIDIVMGEMLDENGEVDLKNIQCTYRGKLSPLQEIHYVCREGENRYKSKYFFGGFRYISVDSEISVDIAQIRGIAVYSAFEDTSSFECSSGLINTFYRNTVRSLKGNSIDIPTDCPTRERMGWTGDSQVFFDTASYLVNYAPFIRKHVGDLFDRQWKSGRLAQIVPFSNEDWFMWVMNGSVGWADAGVLIPIRYSLKYGDTRLIDRYYKDIVRYGKFMMGRTGRWGGPYAKPVKVGRRYRRYVVNCGQSYGEWAEPNDVNAFRWYDFASPHPEESTAYTAWILGLIADICHEKGDKENESLFRSHSEKVKEAYQELVRTKEHTLDTDRQAKLVRPLYMHLLDAEQESFAKKRLIKALDNYGWRLGTGFLSTPFILDVLADMDPEYAYRLLENEEMPGWLFMAKNSTGTIWEGWEGPESDAGIASLNHYSKGAMTEWLIKGMCGVNIAGENYFIIKPVIGGMETCARASYDSIYGKVSAGWEKDGDTVKLTVDIPPNTRARLQFFDTDVTVQCGHHEFTQEL